MVTALIPNRPITWQNCLPLIFRRGDQYKSMRWPVTPCPSGLGLGFRIRIPSYIIIRFAFVRSYNIFVVVVLSNLYFGRDKKQSSVYLQTHPSSVSTVASLARSLARRWVAYDELCVWTKRMQRFSSWSAETIEGTLLFSSQSTLSTQEQSSYRTFRRVPQRTAFWTVWGTALDNHDGVYLHIPSK